MLEFVPVVDGGKELYRRLNLAVAMLMRAHDGLDPDSEIGLLELGDEIRETLSNIAHEDPAYERWLDEGAIESLEALPHDPDATAEDWDYRPDEV